MQTKLTKQIVERIKEAGYAIEHPDDVRIRRTYAGWGQRSKGAWSWFLVGGKGTFSCPVGNFHDCGSIYPATRVARAKKLSFSIPYSGQLEIDVEEDG